MVYEGLKKAWQVPAVDRIAPRKSWNPLSLTAEGALMLNTPGVERQTPRVLTYLGLMGVRSARWSAGRGRVWAVEGEGIIDWPRAQQGKGRKNFQL